MYGIFRKEQLTANLNHVGTDKLSLYFLKGWSHFYKDVENKKLYDVDYGGDRSFAIDYPIHNTYNDYFSIPFHAHILDVIHTSTIDKYDYAIYTVYNSGSTMEDVYSDGGSAFLNNFYIATDINDIAYNQGSKLSFFLYLNYIIKQIFTTYGWTVDGYIFSDPGFKKATVINTAFLEYAVNEQKVQTFNLRDFVPSVKISTFLIGLSNRFGWWYDFDYLRKRCTVRSLNDVLTTKRRVDITFKVSTAYNLKISQDKKIYGLSQSGSGDAPKTDQWNYKGALATSAQLPAATAAVSNFVYFITGENRYYYCFSPDNSSYQWQVLTENDFGFIPRNKTDDITTTACIPSMRQMNYKNAFFDVIGTINIPEINAQDDNQDSDNFYVCFAHGVQDDIPAGSNAVHKYAYGSPHPYGINGTKLGDWAMNYLFYELSGNDIGLQNLNWKSFLERLSQEENIGDQLRPFTAGPAEPQLAG
jgi:hypothetical protein